MKLADLRRLFSSDLVIAPELPPVDQPEFWDEPSPPPPTAEDRCEKCARGLPEVKLSWYGSRTAYPEHCGACGLGPGYPCHRGHDVWQAGESPIPLDKVDQKVIKPHNEGTIINAHSYESPNRSYLLCEECGKEHNEYWDEMRDEYYRGRL